MSKPKLTLVQKRSANSAVATADPEEAKLLEDLRGIIWSKAGSTKGNWKTLAAKAKLHPRTVSKFACGDTKRPQLFTIRRMFAAVDYAIDFRPIKKIKAVR